MKNSYTKPSMDTETVDIPVLASQGGSGICGGDPNPGGDSSPIAQLSPFFGLCCGD
ncbi:hypothetical protein JXI42_11105 [bacterium]|nr:hypothetical protein [bacterium]